MSETTHKKALGGKKVLGGSKSVSATQDNGSDSVGVNKWLGSIKDQADDLAGDCGLEATIDVRAIPTSLVVIDETNPRDLEISPEEIQKHIEVLRLPEEAFSEEGEWFADYKTKVEELFGVGRKAEDFLDIAKFAASLKRPENLLHPIVVWREDTLFYAFVGERRYLTHLLLEAPKIKASIWPYKPSVYEMKECAWNENQRDRVSYTTHQRVRNVRQLLDERIKIRPGEKLTARNVAKILGVGHSMGGLYLKLYGCEDAKFNELLKLGKFNNLEEAHDYVMSLDETNPNTNPEKQVEGKGPGNGKKLNESGSLPNRRVLRFNKKADPNPVRFIVSAALEKIGDSELNEAVDQLDPSNPKNLDKVFEALIGYLLEKGVKE